MKASELIKLLEIAILEHGDLEVHPANTGFCGEIYPIRDIYKDNAETWSFGATREKLKTKVLYLSTGVGF